MYHSDVDAACAVYLEARDCSEFAVRSSLTISACHMTGGAMAVEHPAGK